MLKILVFCKLLELTGIVLRTVVRYHYLWYPMTAKLHLQFLNNSSGIIGL